MKKQLFTDGISYIDVDAVERLLQIEQDLQRRKIRQRHTRLLIIPAAALLALLVCMTAVIIPFIPKTLELDYEPSKGMPERVWVYYVNENGAQKRELVKQPQGAQNVFTSWKHLNTVDNEVQLLNYTVTTEPMAGTTVVPDTLWESLMQMLDKTGEQTIVTATLSPEITSYENYDALIESLRQTIAKYAGIDPEQVRILIDGEYSGDTYRGVHFWHSLPKEPVVVSVGSTLEITVGMTNISNQNIEFTGSWSAFVPSAILTMGDSNVILHEDYPMTEEYQKYILAPGESREITYTFPIPENALTGTYDLYVTFGQKSIIYEGVVQVTDIPEINLAVPNYTWIDLSFPESGATLPDEIQFKIISAMRNSVCVGQALCDVEYIVFACMEADYHSSVNYCGSHFHIDGYAWAPTGKDATFMGTLVYALDAYKPDDGYDTLLYYEGEFYGHSAAVDKKFQGMEMGDDRIMITAVHVVTIKTPWENGLIGRSCSPVEDCLLFEDGTCFERILAPDNESGVPWHTECSFCGNLDGESRWFIAQVLDASAVIPIGTYCFEAVGAGDAELRLSYFGENLITQQGLVTGDIVRITYNGYIMETYPGQIVPDTIELVEKNANE